MVDQLEFADVPRSPAQDGGAGRRPETPRRSREDHAREQVLLVNKTDLVSEQQLGAVERLLRKVNPAAELLRSRYGEVCCSLETAR